MTLEIKWIIPWIKIYELFKITAKHIKESTNVCITK